MDSASIALSWDGLAEGTRRELAGKLGGLWGWSRDEEVFEDPFVFRVDRRPNPHLAFGFGEHFCMGAHVARVELETIFRHLLTRLERFEVSGPVERLSSAVNGAIKHLPLRYRMT